MAYRHSAERVNSAGSGIGANMKMQNHSNDYSEDERESQRSGGGVGDERDILNLQNKPIYLLEHLATFTVNKESGILYPADGMRRLLQLEKTTGIWSQKMQLCLDYPWVLIMDYETENIIERFPATLIQEPTAFTSTDAMELYNNILVFIVSGGNGSRSEMHIFQSQSVAAVQLVEDLKHLRNGKVIKQHMQDPNVVLTQQKKERHAMDMVHSGGMGIGIAPSGNGSGDTDSERDVCAINDETSSISSDKYERDVTVLNHCFDDIEKFIARLQHAAAAMRELERRRRNRKSKKKDPGEGLLSLRTRPPQEREFMDIFAKFKLSFNLLAKLKAHIHDPNAPELVHFLFTPLALIVEAANDTYYESQLPAHVVNPLLTREAINLLINCVTSKETELWRSLGDAWVIPRDQWKENVGSYHPVFMDGWSPDFLVIDELDHSPLPATTTVGNLSLKKRLNTDMQQQQSVGENLSSSGLDFNTLDNFVEYGGGSGGGGPGVPPNHMSHIYSGYGESYDISTRSKISVDSIEHDHIDMMRNGHSDHVPSSLPNAAAGIHSITAGIHNLHPIHETTNIDNNNGNKNGIMNQHGRSNGDESFNGDDPQMVAAWLEELQSANANIVLVTYPRTANNDKELSVVRGEYLEVLDDTRKWWKARNIRGQVAHVPHTIVTPYNYDDSTDGIRFNGHQSKSNNYNHQSHLTNKGIKESPFNQSNDNEQWNRNKLLGKKGEFRYF